VKEVVLNLSINSLLLFTARLSFNLKTGSSALRGHRKKVVALKVLNQILQRKLSIEIIRTEGL
jgi:hypothetical protein